MRMKHLLILPLFAMLAACGGGPYYNANGDYITSDYNQPAHDPITQPYHNYNNYTVVYKRAGYYDYYGNYVTVNSNTAVPSDMMPPRGMCRVWLPDRTPDNQPDIEGCTGIQSRVPMGAYVIYGG